MLNRVNKVLFTPTQKAAPAVADLGSFYRAYGDLKVESDVSSGDHVIMLDSTPAGYIRIVTVTLAYDYSSAIDKIRSGAVISGADIWLKSVLNISAEQGVDFSGHIFLSEGDCIQAKFYGCSAGDIICVYVMGYDIKEY